jgi:N-acetylmuramoyl-L-alanine amidase
MPRFPQDRRAARPRRQRALRNSDRARVFASEVKRIASALGIALAAALAVIAAPAVSTARWQAKPVEFELAPAAAPRAAVLSAPKRFQMVGLRWRGRSDPRIELRAHSPDGRWTHWVPVPGDTEDAPDPGRGEPMPQGYSAPVWVGEADRVQYRLSRRVPGMHLHFVNVDGTATAVDRVRSAIRRAVNSAVGSVASLFSAPSADAQGAQPHIVPRSGWGAADCRPRRAPDYGVVKAAFIHHTVNANDYSRAEAPGVVLGICLFHRNSNGWDDIGYNFLVDKYGTIYEGRAGGLDRPVVGAQAQGYNAQSTGIAQIGTFIRVGQTQAALQSTARLLRWKLPISGVPTYGHTTLTSAGGSDNNHPAGAHVRVNRISGHRDVDATECPGDALYAQLPELRRMVGNLRPGGTATRLSVHLSPKVATYGRTVRIFGSLRSASGAPVGFSGVQVQSHRGRRWRRVGVGTTAADGAYSISVKVSRNRTVRARFDGNSSLAGATSGTRRLLVRARIGVTAPPAAATRARAVTLRGAVAPAKRRLVLVVQRRFSARFRTVLRKAVGTRRGRFATAFAPGRRGLYRYYLSADADTATVRSRSPRYLLPVG